MKTNTGSTAEILPWEFSVHRLYCIVGLVFQVFRFLFAIAWEGTQLTLLIWVDVLHGVCRSLYRYLFSLNPKNFGVHFLADIVQKFVCWKYNFARAMELQSRMALGRSGTFSSNKSNLLLFQSIIRPMHSKLSKVTMFPSKQINTCLVFFNRRLHQIYFRVKRIQTVT